MCDFSDNQRKLEEERLKQQREQAEAQRNWEISKSLEAGEKYDRENLITPDVPDAMPYPDLTPDRHGRLSNRQQAEKALYSEFSSTILRTENAKSDHPIDVHNPAHRVKIRKELLRDDPKQVRALDEVEAILSENGMFDKLAKAEFITGDDPEEAFFHCAMEDCIFGVDHSTQPGTVGAALTNYRVLIMFRPNSLRSFTAHSLPWETVQSSRLSSEVSGQAIVTITTEKQSFVTENQIDAGATYVLQGPNEEISDINEHVNTWLTTYNEEFGKEFERLTRPKKSLFTALSNLFKK